jgi:hypothetical protein
LYTDFNKPGITGRIANNSKSIKIIIPIFKYLNKANMGKGCKQEN